jgi:hypothetical protein
MKIHPSQRNHGAIKRVGKIKIIMKNHRTKLSLQVFLNFKQYNSNKIYASCEPYLIEI